jgi:phosphoglucomutase
VYTPLNGSGLECVKKLLAKLGVTHVTVVPEQEKPDGNFPTCPYPNPEIREAMQKGLELCDKVHPDLLLGTDPDCDRCGTAVPDGKGGYRLITGNEMGIILLDYICRTRKALGTMPEHPVAVTTIVSTDMATPVAAKYGVELRRTLTGFKFIGEQIGLLEAAGEADRYIFGFEESYGYLSGAHVRDKDAVNATLLVCEAAAWYAKQGMTLLDAINKLYAEFGCYRNALHSFAFEGESGMHTMDAIMKQLRQTPPTAIGGMAVESMVDYNTAGTGLPKANVLEFRLAGGAKLMVRPSGTEPKIKVYLSAVAPTEEAADAINDTLGKAAAALLKA